MRSSSCISGACWLVVLWCTSASAGVAISGGKLYTMEGAEAEEGVTILVSNGVIEAVGRDLEIPFDYERVDAQGKVVTPGLIESYSQLGLVEISGESTTVDSSVAAFSLGPAFDVRYSINANSTLFPVNVMEGITRAITAPRSSNDPLAGWGAAVDLATGHLTHSEIALFGNVGAGTAAFVGGSRSAVLQRLHRAFRAARRYSPSRYRPGEHDYRHQDMEALRRFRGSDVPLVMEVHRANEIVQVVNLAEDLNISLVLRGGTEAWQVADLLAEHGVAVIVDPLGNLPVSYDRLGARLDNAALLHRAGVRVLISSQETHNVRLLRQGAGNAVANGLPWIAALAGVTRYPAEVFGLDDIGTLTVGARADIVIWSGDPLEVTTWAERVMVDGTWVPMRSRQTRLFERYRDLGGDKPFGYR